MTLYQPNTLGLKVLTPDGYKDFAGVSKVGLREIWRTELEGDLSIETTNDHQVFIDNENKKSVKDLIIGEYVETNLGVKKVLSVINTGKIEMVYDLIEVDGGHRFYADNVLVSNCKFVSEDDTLINPMVLNTLDSVQEQFLIDDIRWFEEPKPNHVYGVGWDPAMGSLKDFASIQVLDLTTLEQVAEWRSNRVPVQQQTEVLIKILYFIYQTMYNDPRQEGEPELFWTVENNGLGLAADSEINHIGEENLPGMLVNEPRRSRGGYRAKGLRTSHPTKLAACSLFKKLVERGKLKVKSRPLIREMKNFVRGGGSYQAKAGEHDDLIMSMIIVVRLLSIVQEWDDDIGEAMGDDSVLEDMVIEPMPIIT